MGKDAKDTTDSSAVDVLPNVDNLSGSEPVEAFTDLVDEMAGDVNASNKKPEVKPEKEDVKPEIKDQTPKPEDSKDLHKNPRFQEVIKKKNDAEAKSEKLATELDEAKAKLAELETKSEDVIENEEVKYDEEMYDLIKEKVEADRKILLDKIVKLEADATQLKKNQTKTSKNEEKRNAEIAQERLNKECLDLATKTKGQEYEFNLAEQTEILNEIRTQFPTMTLEDNFEWAKMKGLIKPNKKVEDTHDNLRNEILDKASQSDDSDGTDLFVPDQREHYTDIREACANAAKNLEKQGIKFEPE